MVQAGLLLWLWSPLVVWRLKVKAGQTTLSLSVFSFSDSLQVKLDVYLAELTKIGKSQKYTLSVDVEGGRLVVMKKVKDSQEDWTTFTHDKSQNYKQHLLLDKACNFLTLRWIISDYNNYKFLLVINSEFLYYDCVVTISLEHPCLDCISVRLTHSKYW